MDSPPDGLTLTIGGTAIAAIGGAIGAWIKARYGRTEVRPQPLIVKCSESPVDDKDCKERMRILERRVEKLEENLDKKLDAMYTKINACATSVAEISGQIQEMNRRGTHGN